MNAVIKGAKAGQGKSRQPVIAPDSAQSKTYIKILYGLSEGEVEGLANGLQSVYLEETPLQTRNFQCHRLESFTLPDDISMPCLFSARIKGFTN